MAVEEAAAATEAVGMAVEVMSRPGLPVDLSTHQLWTTQAYQQKTEPRLPRVHETLRRGEEEPSEVDHGGAEEGVGDRRDTWFLPGVSEDV